MEKIFTVQKARRNFFFQIIKRQGEKWHKNSEKMTGSSIGKARDHTKDTRVNGKVAGVAEAVTIGWQTKNKDPEWKGKTVMQEE